MMNAHAVLPRYVEYGARVNAPAPFLGKNGVYRILLLDAEHDKLEAMVQKILNVPAGGTVEYRALGSQVMVMIGEAEFSSQAPGFPQMGYVHETQIGIFVPVMAGHDELGVFIPDRLCMSIPYILVDNPMSYVGGREDYGYPKAFGRFTPEGGIGEEVTVQGFGGNFDPNNVAGWFDLIKITAAPAGAAAAAAAEPAWQELADADAVNLPCGIGFLVDLVKGMLNGESRQVFLKQFRDCAEPEGACYQAIVESHLKVESISYSPSPHDWVVEIKDRDSHPIAADLGLGERQTAVLAADLKMTMTETQGEVVAP